jgi:phosphohistidine phosphatase
MRRLFLIRHAKAEPAVGRGDYERRLTERGREDAAAVARALLGRNMLPDALIHSGAARARETAEIFAAEWSGRTPVETDPSLYDASASHLFASARALADARGRIAFVGHNPGLGELAASLAGTGAHEELRRMIAKYPTCAVATLDFRVQRWDEIHRHSALLALYVTPADIEVGAR